MLKWFKISGHSLYPLYKDGERVLCIKVFQLINIKLDDFVVFHLPAYGLMIKQVKAIKNNQYFVQGTDPMSIDSRNFGYLKRDVIQYRVITFKKR